MLLHPGKPEDYWVLSSGCDQEGDVHVVQNTDLDYEGLGVQSNSTSTEGALDGVDVLSAEGGGVQFLCQFRLYDIK